jgi:poly-gamma-glutamate system protein
MTTITVRRLGLACAFALVGWIVVLHLAVSTVEHPESTAMHRAAARAASAFAVVDAHKRATELPFPADSPVPWATLLGEPYTTLTTTLGTRAAKEVATNPAWAALLLRWLRESGVGTGDAVAITASGSFPGLIVSALAAIEEMGARPVLAVSLGASEYGANSEQATWLDLAMWIREAGALETTTVLVTIGGESDLGEGLLPEGREAIRAAALRCGVELFEPRDLEDAIARRLAVFRDENAVALVNVGGGQAAVGRCVHTSALPVGPWERHTACTCDERGVLARLWSDDIPVFHLLRVRELAARWGLDPQPGHQYVDRSGLHQTVRLDRVRIAAVLLLVCAPLVRWPMGRSRRP